MCAASPNVLHEIRARTAWPCKTTRRRRARPSHARGSSSGSSVERRNAVSRNARAPRVHPVGRARHHRRNDGKRRPVLRDQPFDCDSSAGVSGDGGLLTGGSRTVTFTLSPASRRITASTSAPGRPGQDSAIDHRARKLRQRVVGVPGLDPRGHARRAELRVVVGRARQPRGRGLIGRHRRDRAHVDRRLAALGRRRPLQEHPRHVVDVQRKLVLADSRAAPPTACRSGSRA